MSPPNTQRPSGTNVGVFNPGETVYVTGNDFTDGSIRLIVDDAAENVEFQFRASGVWNVTGIQIAAASIFLGWSLKLSGAGEWLQTSELVSGDTSLIPHVFYTDAGTGTVHSPVLGAKVIKNILQPDDSDEVTGTLLSIDVTGTDDTLLSKAYFRVGSIGSTSPVMITLRAGSSTGAIFWQENFPTSTFGTANSEVAIELESLVEASVGEDIYVEMASDNTISLKSNASGFWWVASDFFPLDDVDISTVNGNAVSYANLLAGILIPVSGVNVWTDISGLGLSWALSANSESFSLTNALTGEITYEGLQDAGLRLGGSVEIGGSAGKDAIEIGVSINGAAPTADTITCGFVTPTQPDSVTIAPAKVPVDIGDTLRLQFRNVTDGSSVVFFQAKNVVF